jgi:hypothetical protein
LIRYLLFGAVILVVVLWAARRSRWLRTEGARLLSGALSMALFAAAAFWGMRGAWGTVLVLVTLGIGLALGARRGARPSSNGGATPEPLGLKEARDLLGVSQTASKAEIRAAYNRLMRMAHPDHGGTAGLAAQLNAARDRLLKGP